MPKKELFWVYPCLDKPESRFVIYTADRAEILVEVKQGKIVYHAAPLSPAHLEYFNKNVLTN